MTFRCVSDDENSFAQWYNSTCLTRADPAQCLNDLIYSGFSRLLPPRFRVTEVNNATHVTRDLHINPVQLTDAGVYLCAERKAGVADILESNSARLIVLGNYIGCALIVLT